MQVFGPVYGARSTKLTAMMRCSNDLERRLGKCLPLAVEVLQIFNELRCYRLHAICDLERHSVMPITGGLSYPAARERTLGPFQRLALNHPVSCCSVLFGMARYLL
jgi:hypothetical protein